MEQHKDISIPAPKYGAGKIFILFSYKMNKCIRPPSPTLYPTKKPIIPERYNGPDILKDILPNLFGPRKSGLQAVFSFSVTFYYSKSCFISSVDAPIL